jgi:penicillin-binding protein 1B
VQMPYIRGSEPLAGDSCDNSSIIKEPVESVKSWIRSWLN